MNAKKIMGAVLVALLAAALFVGAGAAVDKGTFFPYQDSNGVLEDGTWSFGSNQVVVKNGIITAESVVPGTYTLGDNTSYFTNPTAAYKLVANTTSGIYYAVKNGGNVYEGDMVNLTIKALADGVGVDYIMVTYPNGEILNKSNATLNVKTNGIGTYKVVAIFNKGDFEDGMLDNLLLDTLNSFTFNVVEAESATISGSVDTAFSGELVDVKVTGKPGEEFAFALTHANMSVDQYVKLNWNAATKTFNFTMPNNGEATFQIQVNSSANVDANEEDTTIIKLVSATTGKPVKNAEIEFDISAPVVTATLGASSYFIGDVIKISGTSTADAKFTFTISGTNFKETALQTNGVADDNKNGTTWKAALKTADVTEQNNGGKKLDVGTYTIKIYQDGGAEPVKTVAVALKQPFISIIEAPEVVVQGTEVKFLINAEAVTVTNPVIRAYIFGTNYFEQFVGDIKDEDIPNQFTVKLGKADTNATNMSAGQYFAVFQHPMYDQKFNIMANGTSFYLNTSEDAVQSGQAKGTLLFNVDVRQTANAAQALCDALDSQNIDDMYVKYSFFVVGEDESFTISEIPTSVAQGETITISGVSTAAAGKTVQVEMLSTAFAAVPKETVGSAAFILVTTDVADDGTWEVTLDTSDLNVDEYSLKVACGDDTWKNVKINVVEAADEPVTPPTDEPGQDEPGQDEPVAPETPGFGALAALAGLGAVAVLLLRRE